MQTSNQKLDPIVEQKLQEDLAILLSDLKRPKLILEFLSTFLTETELLVLSKRLAILKRLHENNSYERIQKELCVSSATISVVAQMKDKPVSERIVSSLEIHEWAEVTAHKLRHWLAQ